MHENINAKSSYREANTPALELRRMLSDLERHIGKINYSGRVELSEMPGLFQHAADLMAKLEDSGMNIDAESVRFETLSRQFQRDKRTFLKRIGGISVYAKLKPESGQPDANWWWHLDTLIAEEDRTKRQRVLRNSAIACCVFIVIVAVYMLFLAPDEITRQVINLESEAERALMIGDYPAALTAIEQAIAVNPNENRLWVFRGVLHDLMGNANAADEDYTQAQQLYNDQEAFLVARSQVYITANQPEMALTDAEYIIALNPESAMGYLQAGTAYNLMRETYKAIPAFERAAELAEEQGMTELQGLARIQLAYIYSSGME